MSARTVRFEEVKATARRTGKGTGVPLADLLSAAEVES